MAEAAAAAAAAIRARLSAEANKPAVGDTQPGAGAQAAAAAAAAIRARLAESGRLKPSGEAPPVMPGLLGVPGLLGEAPTLLPPPSAILGGGPPPPIVVLGAPPEGTTAEVQINDISSGARTILTRGPKQDEVRLLGGAVTLTVFG